MTGSSHRDVLTRLQDLDVSCRQRFGDFSQARAFALFESLTIVRQLECGTSGTSWMQLERARTGIREILQDIYNQSPFPNMGPNVPKPDGSGLIEFDRTSFDGLYAAAAKHMNHELSPLSKWRAAAVAVPTAYMFVVDEGGGLVVWKRPFRLGDLVLGRNRATVAGVPVAHPMLVPRTLRIRAAGELSPVLGGIDDAEVVGIVANLKSGHFRPPPESAEYVMDACRRANIAPNMCDIITIPRTPIQSQPRAFPRWELT